MNDLCGICGAYWSCDCPRGLRLDADGWESRVVVLPGADAVIESRPWVSIEDGDFNGEPWRRSPMETEPFPFTEIEVGPWSQPGAFAAVERSIMRDIARQAMHDGAFKIAPEGSGLS